MLVWWFGWVLFDNYVSGDWFGGFVVFWGDVGVVDVREGKGDNLISVGWIGYDFLIVCYCCVKV